MTEAGVLFPRRDAERIARAKELLAQLESLWRSRFSQLDALFTENQPSE